MCLFCVVQFLLSMVIFFVRKSSLFEMSFFSLKNGNKPVSNNEFVRILHTPSCSFLCQELY